MTTDKLLEYADEWPQLLPDMDEPVVKGLAAEVRRLRALTPDDCRKCPSFTVLATEVDRLRSELEDAEATIALLREDTAFTAAAVRAKWQECEATFGLYYDGAVQEFMGWLDEQERGTPSAGAAGSHREAT